MNTTRTSHRPSFSEAQPFTSLSALRRRHSVLLSLQQSEKEVERPPLEQLATFVGQVKATGRKLASEQSRDAAQGVLDYWAGIILSKRPDLVSTYGMLEPDEYEKGSEESADSDPEFEKAARSNIDLAHQAENVEKRLNPEQAKVLRILLLRLIKLGATSQELSLALLPATDSLLNAVVNRDIAEQLKSAGVLRTEGSGPDLGYVLAHDSLLTHWSALKDLCNERKSLREIASGWDKSGRSPEALLNRGDQLKQTLDFTDLNEIERAFLDQSRQQSVKHLSVLLGFVSLVLVVIAVAYWKVQISNKALQRERVQLLEANKQLTAERDKAAAAVRELEIALKQAREALKSAETLNIELQRMQAALESIENSQPYLLSAPSNVNMSPINPQTRQDVIKGANESLLNVKRTLSNQFSPKYKF